MRAPPALPAVLAALTFLLAGAAPAAAAPTVSEEVEQCTDEGLQLCVVATGVATIECEPVEDGFVSCLGTATFTGAGGSTMPVAPAAVVQRGAEAIVTMCEDDICLTMFILLESLSCRVGPATPWCSSSSTFKEPMTASLGPGECADFALTALVGARLFLEPRPVNNLLTDGEPYVQTITGSTVEHRVCA